MMFLGEVSEIKVEKQIIIQALKNLLQKYEPFEVTLGGVAKFFADKEKAPYVFTINTRMIEKLRNDLINSMNAIGVTESKDALSFIPHMTLGYFDDNEDLLSIKMKNNTLKVDCVCLNWGDDIEKIKFSNH